MCTGHSFDLKSKSQGGQRQISIVETRIEMKNKTKVIIECGIKISIKNKIGIAMSISIEIEIESGTRIERGIRIYLDQADRGRNQKTESDGNKE
ncbi:hypothetical protein EVAR_8971_1 [Eumeta japonica]|uniref:Uncharacterized protein n=1 Tax=Eumeta variegata TaxID=151549 RepID=A0A4C1WSV7_EUMVA|nr:hypothetical protein EVAR_8971_1 [Eumeta japonica]